MPSEIKIDEKKFNELIGNAVQKSIENVVNGITEKVGEIVDKKLDKKFEEKGLNKIDRSFMNFDKSSIKKMDREERFAGFIKAVADKDFGRAKALSEGNDTEGGYLVPSET